MNVKEARAILENHADALNAIGRSWCRCSDCIGAEGYLERDAQLRPLLKKLWDAVDHLREFDGPQWIEEAFAEAKKVLEEKS